MNEAPGTIYIIGCPQKAKGNHYYTSHDAATEHLDCERCFVMEFQPHPEKTKGDS